MIAIRSHWRSASSIWCVVTSSVVPASSRSSSSRSQTSRRAVGSRPTVGSSRKSTSGWLSSAVAISSRRSMPPESVRPSRSRNEASSIASTACAIRSRRSLLGTPGHAAVELEVLGGGQRAVDRDRLRDVADRLPHGEAVADDVVAGDERAAVRRAQQRREHADRRRLAGAVRAEQAEHLARPTANETPRTASTSPKRTTRPSTSTATRGHVELLDAGSSAHRATSSSLACAARPRPSRSAARARSARRARARQHVGRRTAAAARRHAAASSRAVGGEPDEGRAAVARVRSRARRGPPPRAGRRAASRSCRRRRRGGELADAQASPRRAHRARAAWSASAPLPGRGAARPAAAGSRGSPPSSCQLRERSRARDRSSAVAIAATYINCILHAPGAGSHPPAAALRFRHRPVSDERRASHVRHRLRSSPPVPHGRDRSPALAARPS